MVVITVVPLFAVGVFAFIWIRRWKNDLRQEEEFRRQLSGTPLETAVFTPVSSPPGQFASALLQ